MTHDQRPTLGIDGSCVSRDGYEFIKDDVDLRFYVARQSLVLAYNKPFALPVTIDNLAFQRSMLQGDCDSQAPHVLRQNTDIDLLLWDLTDERYGLVGDGQGGYVTESYELKNTGFDPSAFGSATRVPFGSRTYLALFEQALDRCATDLKDTGVWEKSRAVLPRPAGRMVRGGTASWTTRLIVLRSSILLRRTYAALRQMVVDRGFPTIEIPSDVERYDPGHKWGPAAYHYGRGFYDVVNAAILEELR